jgi:hypothetical protein
LRSSGSARGDGVAQYRGEPVFVPVTVPGDRVRVRLGARRHGGQEGFAVDRLASGSGRAARRCRHFGTCGGCALQTRATHHTGGSSWRHCIPPLNASRGHSRGRPVGGGTVHGSRPSPGERGWVGQASLTRTRRRSGGTSRSGPMMSGSIPTRDSPARAAATHARLTGHGFSVCSSCLRPHSMEAGYVSGLGRICPPIPDALRAFALAL